MDDLNPLQREALEQVGRAARDLSAAATPVLVDLVERHGVEAKLLDAARDAIRRKARVAVHFHPDRIVNSGRTVAESLLACGFLTNQFETGISSGSLTPFAGGPRDTWERNLFGGAYQRPGVQPAECSQRRANVNHGQQPGQQGQAEDHPQDHGPVPRSPGPLGRSLGRIEGDAGNRSVHARLTSAGRRVSTAS